MHTFISHLYMQDAVIELSEHGIVLVVEESSCLQAKVYLQKEVFFRLCPPIYLFDCQYELFNCIFLFVFDCCSFLLDMSILLKLVFGLVLVWDSLLILLTLFRFLVIHPLSRFGILALICSFFSSIYYCSIFLILFHVIMSQVVFRV